MTNTDALNPRETHKRLQGIEIARGVAACLVVLYHASRHVFKDTGQAPFHNAFQFGHSGVDFFFVLSGFIIYTAHARDLGQPQQLVTFCKRRLARIFPMYWLALLVVLALAWRSGNLPALLADQASLIRSATLLLPPEHALLGVSWTLTQEMIFYVFFGLMIVNARLSKVLLVVWLSMIAGGQIWPEITRASRELNALCAAYNLQFMMGMLAAWWHLRHPDRTWSWPQHLACAGLAVMAWLESAHVGTDAHDLRSTLSFGVLYTTLTLGLARLTITPDHPVIVRLLTLGTGSYSIYLFHIIGVSLSHAMLSKAGVLTHLPMAATHVLISACGLGLGLLMSMLFEQPIQAFFRPLLHRART